MPDALTEKPGILFKALKPSPRRDGKLHTRKPSDFSIAYRHVVGVDEEWFVSGTFFLQPGEQVSLDKITQLLERLLSDSNT
jgi:hypothetical protein